MKRIFLGIIMVVSVMTTAFVSVKCGVGKESTPVISQAQESIDNRQVNSTLCSDAKKSDLRTFGLVGPVKEVKENGSIYLLFDRNGVLTSIDAVFDFQRDSRSRLAEYSKEPKWFSFDYNNDGYLSIYKESEYGDAVTTYTSWDRNGNPLKGSCDFMSHEYSESYSFSNVYKDIDEYGNWRTCEETRKGRSCDHIDGSSKKFKKVVERKRVITYYAQ